MSDHLNASRQLFHSVRLGLLNLVSLLEGSKELDRLPTDYEMTFFDWGGCEESR